MADINRGLLINYKHIFGNSNHNYSGDISSLDKLTWFRILARFNFLLRENKKPSVVDVLSMWFSAENNDYANNLYKKIQHAYGANVSQDRSITTLNVWTNLTLLDDILKQQQNGKNFNDIETEKRLFDAYLSVNELYGTKSDKITTEIHKEGPGADKLLDWFAKMSATTLLAYNDISNQSVIELWIAQFIKSCFCFEYFEQDHPELLKLFLQKYTITDWRDYLRAIMPVIDHAVFHSETGLSYLSISNSKDKEKSKLFLDSLSLTSEIIYEVKTDFIHARSNPLFKIDEETYLVIDQVLIVNKMYNSIFFEMLGIINDNKISVKPYKNFFQLYTSEFIEHFISYKILDGIYNKKQLYKLSGREIKARYNVDTEPDYYVRNGNKVFLYEIKGSIITGDAKQSFTYKEIEKELIKKYYYDEKEDNKAIKQLIERIKILFSGNAVYDPNCNSKSIKIFPILLVSELALITPGINHIMNKWFKEEISNDDMLKAHKDRIHNLVILDINSLILYSDQLRTNKDLLEKMILAYEKQTDLKRIFPIPKSIQNEQQLEATIMNMLVPFSFSFRSKTKVSTPSLFLKCAKSLFPDEDIVAIHK